MIDKAIKAIILSRVSSKDQEEGYSLEVQKYRLEKYCERTKVCILYKALNLLNLLPKVIINILGKSSNLSRNSENLSLLLLIKLIVSKEAKKNLLY